MDRAMASGAIGRQFESAIAQDLFFLSARRLAPFSR
jgi:hypothetical protein